MAGSAVVGTNLSGCGADGDRAYLQTENTEVLATMISTSAVQRPPALAGLAGVHVSREPW